MYWIIHEYVHYKAVRSRYTLRGYIHKCFELYRTRLEWYERARALHISHVNELKGRKTKITNDNEINEMEQIKTP